MNDVLVINAGSSSLKYQLIDMDAQFVKAKGLVEKIGIEGSVLTHKPAGKDKVVIEQPMKDHEVAIGLVLGALTDKEHGVVSDMNDIKAVGHRVVHGGETFSAPALIDDETLAGIAEYIEFAPLHNPANITGINACKALMPNTPMVAVFDTAFHQTMPQHAYMYAINYEDYEAYKIRRYGFHGTSHDYISHKAAEMLGKNIEDLKIVTCHLGNGASVAAVKNGKCVDTSMGFTPLAGLEMGTRAGDLDTAVLPFIMSKKNLTADEAIDYLNKKCGVLGISGVSSDFRDVEAEAAKGNKRAQLALDIFTYRVKKYIGSYAAAMGGVDAVVFAGGIGENDIATRLECVKGLDFMGIEIDEKLNDMRGEDKIVSPEGADVKVIVIATDEEMMIAKQTYALVTK